MFADYCYKRVGTDEAGSDKMWREEVKEKLLYQLTFIPGACIDGDYFEGSIYQHYAVPYAVDGYAAIVSGTITVTKDSDIDESSANYTIVIEGEDVNGNAIKVTMPSTKVNLLSDPNYEYYEF